MASSVAASSTPRFQTKLFINNEFVDAVSGKTFPTVNPANKEVIVQVAEADKADVDIAVAAARKAFKTWGKSTGYTRAALLRKLADLVERDLEELAMIESLDNGKPVSVARAADLPLVIQCLRYYSGWADKIEGKTIGTGIPNSFVYTTQEAVGCVAQIIPWNFPLLMLAWKVGPAIAAGCTTILKVAEQTPLSALRFAELVVEAGFPPGVIQVLAGYGPTAGAALTAHPQIDKIAFTGSTEVGKIIAKACATNNLKRVTLELGGKSALIVCDDADVDAAVETAHFGLFFNAGQCCIAASRLYVQEGIYEKFVQKSAERAKARKVGHGLDASVEQGPQVDQEQHEKVLSYIAHGKAEGARLVAGGNAGQGALASGFFVEPTVFADVTDGMKIADEEIFGPVQSILKFKSLDEVIERANANNYGLGAGLITKDLDTALYLSRNLRAGTVYVNCWNCFDAAAPFGGFKDSGVGRELGEVALNNYLENKTVIIKASRNL